VRAVFVDANNTLAAVTEKLRRAGDPPLAIHRDPDVKPDELPVVLGDAEIAIIDHTSMPTPLAAQCRGLKHVVFLGTGARSYMSPEHVEQELHVPPNHAGERRAHSARRGQGRAGMFRRSR
jgi:D-3-phosphoglycerate dehydrogenase